MVVSFNINLKDYGIIYFLPNYIIDSNDEKLSQLSTILLLFYIIFKYVYYTYIYDFFDFASLCNRPNTNEYTPCLGVVISCIVNLNIVFILTVI